MTEIKVGNLTDNTTVEYHDLAWLQKQMSELATLVAMLARHSLSHPDNPHRNDAALEIMDAAMKLKQELGG